MCVWEYYSWAENLTAIQTCFKTGPGKKFWKLFQKCWKDVRPCIVFDIDGMLLECFMNFLNIEKNNLDRVVSFNKPFYAFSTFNKNMWFELRLSFAGFQIFSLNIFSKLVWFGSWSSKLFLVCFGFIEVSKLYFISNW